MTLYAKRESVHRAAQKLLSTGKKVRLVVGSLESQSRSTFQVHQEIDLADQVEHAFTEMISRSLSGVKVEELMLSSE